MYVCQNPSMYMYIHKYMYIYVYMCVCAYVRTYWNSIRVHRTSSGSKLNSGSVGSRKFLALWVSCPLLATTSRATPVTQAGRFSHVFCCCCLRLTRGKVQRHQILLVRGNKRDARCVTLSLLKFVTLPGFLDLEFYNLGSDLCCHRNNNRNT